MQEAISTATPSTVTALPLHGRDGSDHSAAKQTSMQTLQVDQKTENLKSFLAPGDVVKGDLEVAGGARIAGEVTGSLICQDGSAIVEETGVIGGEVKATMRIINAGRIGTSEAPSGASCPGQIIVLGEGCIEGDVTYGQLVTYDSGSFTGRVVPWAKRQNQA
jgi:cytoskeletal protein CcmA (bactofilin family)